MDGFTRYFAREHAAYRIAETDLMKLSQLEEEKTILLKRKREITANFSVQQFPSGSPPKINLKKIILLPRAPKVRDYDHPSPQIFNQYPYKWLMKTSPKSRIER